MTQETAGTSPPSLGQLLQSGSADVKGSIQSLLSRFSHSLQAQTEE
jgi:hypothetical protein